MGFLEKLKNTFFEEEYVEVEERVKPRKEIVHERVKTSSRDIKPLIEEEKQVRAIRKDEIVHEGIPEDKYKKLKEEQEIKSIKDTFEYFDEDFDEDFDCFEEKEDDYKEIKYKEEVIKPVEKRKETTNAYNNPNYSTKSISSQSSTTNVYSKKMETGFKPTPIISPIYGILDQNYTKDEVTLKKEVKPTSSYVSRKNVDLDSVREKAFGSLTTELGLTSQKEDKISDYDEEENEIDYEDNLLYDMTDVTTTPTVDKVTLQDAEEYFQDLGLEYNIDYKDAKLERATGRRVAKNPKTPEIEEDEIKETVPNKETKDYQFSVEDNLFDLIDSMYEEKE